MAHCFSPSIPSNPSAFISCAYFASGMKWKIPAPSPSFTNPSHSNRPASRMIVKCTSCRPGLERSEEHTSELQSRGHLVCRLLLEKKKKKNIWTAEKHTERRTKRNAYSEDMR